MIHILLSTGMISLALGAVSGFALLISVDYPEKLKSIGIVDRHRIRQVHLDWIIMGMVMAIVALAAPQLPEWVCGLVLFGGIVNPLTFVPMIFSKTIAETKVFQIVSMISFVSLSIGLCVVAYWVVSNPIS